MREREEGQSQTAWCEWGFEVHPLILGVELRWHSGFWTACAKCCRQSLWVVFIRQASCFWPYVTAPWCSDIVVPDGSSVKWNTVPSEMRIWKSNAFVCCSWGFEDRARLSSVLTLEAGRYSHLCLLYKSYAIMLLLFLYLQMTFAFAILLVLNYVKRYEGGWCQQSTEGSVQWSFLVGWKIFFPILTLQPPVSSRARVSTPCCSHQSSSSTTPFCDVIHIIDFQSYSVIQAQNIWILLRSA